MSYTWRIWLKIYQIKKRFIENLVKKNKFTNTDFEREKESRTTLKQTSNN